MEKRLPLAMILSLFVLIGWQLVFPPEAPPEGADAGTAPRPTASGDGSVPPAAQAADEGFVPVDEVVAAEEEEELEIVLGAPGEEGRFLAVFSNRGGVLRSLRTAEYYTRVGLGEVGRNDPANWLPLVESVDTGSGVTGSLELRTRPSSADLVNLPLDRVLWRMESLQDDDGRVVGVSFTHAPGTGVVFEKRITRVPGSPELELELSIENHALERSGRVQFQITPTAGTPPEFDGRFYPEPVAVASGPPGSPEPTFDSERVDKEARERTGPLNAGTPLAFAGAINKYFAVLLREDLPAGARPTLQGASWRRIPDARWAEDEGVPLDQALRYVVADATLELELPPRGERRSYTYRLYAGPKGRERLLAASPDFEAVLENDLGFFSGIGSLLLAVLGVFHGLVGNWGFAIILLTILVRLVLFPINRRSQTAMARHAKKMKRVQPLLDEVKKKHAKDPQKLRQEQARVMQEEGAFPPLGGCLPAFLQIPVFLGLFNALRTSFDLRHAPWALWVEDLSQPDRLMKVDWDLLFFHVEYLNVLPILMVVLWVIQQRTMPTPEDENAQRMKKMMTFMSVGMGFFLYSYASGLSLYMITQSSLGIFEQKVIKKMWPIDDSEIVAKKKSGCGPMAGMMEKMAEQQKAHLEKMRELERQKGTKRGPGKQQKKKRAGR